MPLPSQNVRGFVSDAYQLVSAHNPTAPLHGNDLSKGIQFLNELMYSFAANGQMLTVSRTVELSVTQGQGFISIGSPDFTPTPDITEGRLSQLMEAWLVLEGVTYPLVAISESDYNQSWKYQPMEGLPRFIVIYQETDISYVRIFPSPSQEFDLFISAKFEISEFNANDTMTTLPKYYMRYLKLALASDLADYKGRSEAWTPKLEAKLKDAKADMIATSPINLSVNLQDTGITPNGAWRVISGI